jgi:hypothetical protein
MSIRWPGRPPTLEEIEERFGIDPDGVDRRFGVVEVDPDDHLFTLRLEAAEAAKLGSGQGAEGPFSDPEIAAFGPPRS